MSLGGGQNLSDSFMEGFFADPRFVRDPLSIAIKPDPSSQNNWTKVSAILWYQSTRRVALHGPSGGFSRLASWAAAATVTDPQSRLVGPGKASINSSSSTQSSAASLACSGPNNSVTALMKAPSSRSAMTISSASAGLGLFLDS